MHLILTLFLFISCSFKESKEITDKSKALKAMDSDGDQISDFDEISQGTNRYVANLTVEKPILKNLKLSLKLAQEDKEEIIEKKFTEIKTIDFQKELLSIAHHEHGNTLLSLLQNPHKDSFRLSLKEEEEMSLKIKLDKARTEEKELKLLSLTGELKNFTKGSVHEVFIGNTYIGSINKSKFIIESSKENILALLSKEQIFIRPSNFKVGKKNYLEFKRALLKNSRLFSISYNDKRVEYFVSKKINNLSSGFKEIFSKAYKVEDEEILRMGLLTSTDNSKIVLSSKGNPFKRLSSELRFSLIDKNYKKEHRSSVGLVSSTTSSSESNLGIVDKNSSINFVINLYNQEGIAISRSRRVHTIGKCPPFGCLRVHTGRFKHTIDFYSGADVARDLNFTKKITDLSFVYLQINKKEYPLLDLIKKKLANIKVLSKDEAYITIKSFESFFDGDETSEMKLVLKGLSRTFYPGMRIVQFSGSAPANIFTFAVYVNSYKQKISPQSVRYAYLRKSLKLKSHQVARSMNESTKRNIGYSYVLKGAVHE